MSRSSQRPALAHSEPQEVKQRRAPTEPGRPLTGRCFWDDGLSFHQFRWFAGSLVHWLPTMTGSRRASTGFNLASVAGCWWRWPLGASGRGLELVVRSRVSTIRSFLLEPAAGTHNSSSVHSSIHPAPIPSWTSAIEMQSTVQWYQ